jgi:uncharacterized protein
VIVAVLDTNTIVSATLESRGISNHIVQAARSAEFLWASSSPIVAEVVTTLQRRRIREKYHLTDADIERVRDLLQHETLAIPITTRVQGAATHPEDDLILATAVSAKADYLVTGDGQLQRLGTYRGAQIVSPRRFREILEQQGAP